MLRFAAIGAVVLIGCGLAAPAGADGVPPGAKVAPPAPICNCPPVVHRRVHARVRHRRLPPAALVVREGPDYYNFLVPSTYDPAYDRVMVDHFRYPVVTGFNQPWRPRPVWPGILPYRVQVAEGVLQYDGLIGRYVPLAHEDAALAAAALPPPPPPPR
jgi:hypothetical protein